MLQLGFLHGSYHCCTHASAIHMNTAADTCDASCAALRPSMNVIHGRHPCRPPGSTTHEHEHAPYRPSPHHTAYGKAKQWFRNMHAYASPRILCSHAHPPYEALTTLSSRALYSRSLRSSEHSSSAADTAAWVREPANNTNLLQPCQHSCIEIYHNCVNT